MSKKYIVHIHEGFLQKLFWQRGCVTDEEKNKVFQSVVGDIAKAVSDDRQRPIFNSDFYDQNGVKQKSWYLEEIERGECVKAVIEDKDGQPLQEIHISNDTEWLPAADYAPACDEPVMVCFKGKDALLMFYACMSYDEGMATIEVWGQHDDCGRFVEPIENVWWRRIAAPVV